VSSCVYDAGGKDDSNEIKKQTGDHLFMAAGLAVIAKTFGVAAGYRRSLSGKD